MSTELIDKGQQQTRIITELDYWETLKYKTLIVSSQMALSGQSPNPIKRLD